MKPKSENNLFMVADGNGLKCGEVRTYVPGQVLDIALHAHIHYCTASEDQRHWRLRRGHVYDINAHVESVTTIPTDEADLHLGVINCGELMFTDSFFSPSSWFTTFSARIELSIEEHSEYMKNRLNGIRPSEESLRLQFPLGGLTSFTPTPAILLFSGWENSGQTKIRTTH